MKNQLIRRISFFHLNRILSIEIILNDGLNDDQSNEHQSLDVHQRIVLRINWQEKQVDQ